MIRLSRERGSMGILCLFLHDLRGELGGEVRDDHSRRPSKPRFANGPGLSWNLYRQVVHMCLMISPLFRYGNSSREAFGLVKTYTPFVRSFPRCPLFLPILASLIAPETLLPYKALLPPLELLPLPYFDSFIYAK